MTTLPSLHRVITNTIRGAFIADAASMGTHWIYNPKDVVEKIRTLGKTIEAPEFVDPPSPNYYSSTEFPNHYLQGMLSPYGEQLLFVTQYTASKSSSSSSLSSSSSSSSSSKELTGDDMSHAMFQWATTFGGRLDHATTTFMEHIQANQMYPECGANDDQGNKK